MIDEDDREEDEIPKHVFERMSTPTLVQYMKSQHNPKQLDFRHFSNSKNILKVDAKFQNQIDFDWREATSNRTLFNPAITARPIQLKNIIQGISFDYRGTNAPDRFNQANYTYCQKNGFLYRNFETDQAIEAKKLENESMINEQSAQNA